VEHRRSECTFRFQTRCLVSKQERIKRDFGQTSRQIFWHFLPYYYYLFNTPKQQRAKPTQHKEYNAKKLLHVATNNRQKTFQNTATLCPLLLCEKLPSDHSQYSTCMPAHTCYLYVWLQANTQSGCQTPSTSSKTVPYLH